MNKKKVKKNSIFKFGTKFIEQKFEKVRLNNSFFRKILLFNCKNCAKSWKKLKNRAKNH